MYLKYISLNKAIPFLNSVVSAALFLMLFLHLFFYPKTNAEEKKRILTPIPDGLVVLTFDDGNVSDLKTVAPLLREYGFNATFFISGGFGIGRNGRLGWNEIKALDKLGFEIGNHTASHPNLVGTPKFRIRTEIEDFDKECSKRSVSQPISFAYPGGHADQKSIEVLVEQNYTFARRGTDPELPLLDWGGRGVAYDPLRDHPLMIPSTLVVGPNTDLSDLEWAVRQARDGKISVITFHGVPDIFSHCSTSPEKFAEHIQYLSNQSTKVISIRDLSKYVDTSKRFENYFEAIKDRLGIQPFDLKCEYLTRATESVAPRPRLSWKLKSNRRQQMQLAYQILVSSREDLLKENVGDLWDSGKVMSSNSIQIPYQGKALQSHRRSYWKVRVWNQPGEDGRYANRGYLDPQIVALLKESQPSAYSPINVLPALDQIEVPTDRSEFESKVQYICSEVVIDNIRSQVHQVFAVSFLSSSLMVSEKLTLLKMKILSQIQNIFSKDLVGLRSLSSDFENIEIKPLFVKELVWLKDEMDTVRGRIITRWERRDEEIHFRVQLPTNTKVDIYFTNSLSPGIKLIESGIPVWQGEKFIAGASGILGAARVGEVLVIKAGGGLYNFRILH